MDDTCERRARFAEALNKSLGIIVAESGGDIGAILTHGLRPIADAIAMDQIAVYRLLSAGSVRRFGQIYRWAREAGGTAPIIEELREVPDHPAVAKWIESGEGGYCVNTHSGIASAAEAEFLARYGIKSLLLSPILVKGELWGAVAFQDCENERPFDDASVEFLSSSARICAHAFIIDETAKSRKRSNDLANALNKMSEIFLTQSGRPFEEMMNDGGKLLATIAEVERFSLLRNTTEDGVLYMSQIYRWEEASGGTTTLNDKFVHVAYQQVAPVWEREFKAGKSLNGPIRLMPEHEAAVLKNIGTLSAFLAPIHINGEPWGFAIFEDHEKERYFDDELAKTLRSAAFLFVNAIMRSELSSELASERDFTQKIIDAAPIGINMWDDKFNLIGCNDAIEKIFGTPKQNFLDNFGEFSPEYQPDGIRSDVKVKTLLGRVHVGETITSEWEHRSATGEPIPCEVTQTNMLYNNKEIAVVYMYDLRNIKKMEKAVTEAGQALALIDGVPLSCTLLDKDANVLTCNKSAVEFFGLGGKNDIHRMFVDLMPESQPDGRNSNAAAAEALLQAHRDGRVFIPNWVHRSLSGEPLPCEVTLVRVEYGGDQVIAGYARDMRAVMDAEAKTKEAEKRAWLMLNSMPLACSLLDGNYECIDCNDEAVKLFCVSSKQEYLDSYSSFWPPRQPDGKDSFEEGLRLIKHTFEHGYLNFEWQYLIGGEPVPCEVTLVRVAYGNDHIIAAYTRDLRAEKEAEAKAVEADERARLMLEQAPLVSLLWDNKFNILECNQEAVNIFGLSSKKEVAEKFFELLPERQPSGITSMELLQNAQSLIFKENVEFAKIELTMMKAVTGETIPFDITIVRISDAAVLTYGLDLRERNATIAKMREADERAQIMFDAAPLAGCMFDSEINMLDCNQEIVKMCGLMDKQAFLQRHSEFIPKYQPDGALSTEVLAKNIKTVFEKGYHFFEFMHRKMSGEPLPVRSTLLSIKHRGEDVIAAYFTDLTEQKAMVQLVKQQAEAEAANRAKSSFLATMSHEMRTPMNAIIGMTSIGKSSKDVERKDYALHKIEDAAVHLLSVINDVLDISKIEANKLELSPVEFNFERILQKIVNIINFRMDERHQKFTVYVDRKIPRFVVGDDHRLSQVILNLLSNAVKFSPEQGEISLRVTLVNEQDGVCEIRTEVSDNGIGIAPEKLEKLFHAFHQADSGISREFGGTGLGLSISKHIVELMGGKIWVESEVGKGSRFIFTVKAERGTRNVTTLLAPGIKWENMRVLVVDDEQEVCAYFNDLFAQLGLNCVTASDGFEACSSIENTGSYDIYFVDWRMPGMDGIELTRKIKTHDKDRPSVVVMISSADWAVIKDIALDAGVSKYLLKPLFSSAIIDCINECLGLDVADDEHVEISSGGRFAGKKLLIAEDVEINREIIISLLEDTGISIDCAQNGLEAVEMIIAAPDKYDAVLMDVQMPKMDGLEATRLIRAVTEQRLMDIPIIAMTAHVFKSDIEECIAAGMNDHIGKPIDIDDVMKKLYKYLHPSKR